MTTMDDQRMEVSSIELREILGIAPLAKIIIEYARYSEAELVRAVLMSRGSMVCFIIGEYHYGPEYIGHCWVGRYSIIDNDQVDLGGDIELCIRFGHFGDVYGNIIPITINDLLPSRGLNVKTQYEYENDAIDECREQYLAQMRKAMSQI